jgi:hypothetical protein
LDIRERGTILIDISKDLCGAIQALYEQDLILEMTNGLPL